MSYTTQKDLIKVGFLNQTLDPKCSQNSGLVLKTYNSSTDVRALDSRRNKQAQYIADLVACRTFDDDSGDSEDGFRINDISEDDFSDMFSEILCFKNRCHSRHGNLNLDDLLSSFRRNENNNSPNKFNKDRNITQYKTNGNDIGNTDDLKNHIEKFSLLECMRNFSSKQQSIPPSETDSLIIKTTEKLSDFENLLKENRQLKEELVCSAEEMRKLHLENKRLQDIHKNGDPTKIREFEMKIEELSATGRINKDDMHQLLKLRCQIGDRQKAIELLEAENNALKRLTEKLSERVQIPNINIEPETSTDVKYLQGQVNYLKREIGVLRIMQDECVKLQIDFNSMKLKYDNMNDQQKQEFMSKDNNYLKTILDERDKLRCQLDKMLGMESKIIKLKEKAKKADELEQKLMEVKNGSNIAYETLKDCKKQIQLAEKVTAENEALKKRLKALEKGDSDLLCSYQVKIDDLNNTIRRMYCELKKIEKENCCLKRKLQTSSDAIQEYESQIDQMSKQVDIDSIVIYHATELFNSVRKLALNLARWRIKTDPLYKAAIYSILDINHRTTIHDLRSTMISKMDEIKEFDDKKSELISNSKICLEQMREELKLRCKLQKELKQCKEKLNEFQKLYEQEKLESARDKKISSRAKTPEINKEFDMESLENECKQALSDFEKKTIMLKNNLDSCKNENELLKIKCNELEQELQLSKNENESLKKEIESALNAVSLEKELESCKNENKLLKQNVNDLNSNIMNLNGELQSYKNELKKRDELAPKVEVLQDELETCKNENACIKRDLGLCKKENIALGKDVESYQKENDVLKEKINDLEKELESHIKQYEALEQKLTASDKDKDDKINELFELRNRIQKEKQNCEAKENELEKLESKYEDLKWQLDEMQSKELSRGQNNEKLQKEFDDLLKEFDSVNKEIENNQKEINKYAEHVRVLQEQNKKYKSLINDYEERLQNKNNELGLLEDKLSEMDKKLKEALQEEAKDVQKCYEYKKDLKLALENAKNKEIELETLRADIEHLKYQLNEKDVQIENLNKQLEKYQNETERLKSISSTQLEKNKNEKNRLIAEIDAKNEEIAKLNASINKKDKEIISLRDENEKLSEELNKAETELKSLQNEQNQLNDKIKRKDMDIVELKNEKDHLNEQLKKVYNNLKKFNEEKDHLLGQIYKKDLEIRELKAKLDKAENELANLKSELEINRKEKSDLSSLIGEIEKEKEKNNKLQEMVNNFDQKLANVTAKKSSSSPVSEKISQSANADLQNIIRQLKNELENERYRNEKLSNELKQCQNKLQEPSTSSKRDDSDRSEAVKITPHRDTIDMESIRSTMDKALDYLKKEHMTSLKKLQDMYERQLKDLNVGHDKEIEALKKANDIMRNSLDNIRQKMDQTACICDKKEKYAIGDGELTKLQCICKKVLEGGIYCLTLPELTYLHAEVYKAGLKLRPDSTKCANINNMLKCCKCSGFACCIPCLPREKEKHFFDKVMRLEKELSNANNILLYLKGRSDKSLQIPKSASGIDEYQSFRSNDEINQFLEKISEKKPCSLKRSTKTKRKK